MFLVVGEILGSCHNTMSTLALDRSRISLIILVGLSVGITSRLCDQTLSLSKVCGSEIWIDCCSKWWAFVMLWHVELISSSVIARLRSISVESRRLVLKVGGKVL